LGEKKAGGELKRGEAPLFEGEKGRRRVKERRSLSFLNISPFPLLRGRGIKGDGVTR
jgi:hypothetical protein